MSTNTTILNQLSSQIGDKTEASNIEVSKKCLKEPKLLEEIVQGFKDSNMALIADCAEVFTFVAQEKPELIKPYVSSLIPFLGHKTTKVRWEATHTLSLIASLVPEKIEPILGNIFEHIKNDASTIVRDYSTDTLAVYASTSPAAAKKAYPLLIEVSPLWAGKHTHRALVGLKNVANQLPELRDKIKQIAEKYQDSPRGVVKKAAKDLLKEISKA